jgi:peptide/nickel transport system substrate-binding protein
VLLAVLPALNPFWQGKLPPEQWRKDNRMSNKNKLSNNDRLNMMRRLVRLLLICILTILMVPGCVQSGSPSGNAPDQSDDGSGTTKDSLVISVGGQTGGNYDPITGYGSSGYGIFHTALLKINNDVDAVPDLASAYTISEDCKVYTFTIRDDIKFSDGVALTPDDVVFTYLTAKESGSSIDLTMLEKAEVIEGNKVQFTLNKVFSPFIRTTALLGIVPEHAYDENYAANPIGTGPFKVKQLDVGQQLIVEPNEYFYGIKSPFKQITFLSLDEEVALADAKSGALDVVMVNPEYATETVQDMHIENFKTSDNRGFNLPMLPEQVNENGVTVGNNVTSDRAVREALNIGISRQEIINNALNGIGTPSRTYFQGLPWDNTEPAWKDGQVDKAKELLEAAGWVDSDGDGIREKDGVKCESQLLDAQTTCSAITWLWHCPKTLSSLA